MKMDPGQMEVKWEEVAFLAGPTMPTRSRECTKDNKVTMAESSKCLAAVVVPEVTAVTTILVAAVEVEVVKDLTLATEEVATETVEITQPGVDLSPVSTTTNTMVAERAATGTGEMLR